MTKRIIFTVVTILLVLISIDVIAQSHLPLQDMPIYTLPKAFHFEKYSSAIPQFPGTIEKIGTGELFNFYKLPLDKMICISPTKDVTFHINVYDPTNTPGYISENIPNALSKGELIK